MTALSQFYAAVERGQMPAAVPIHTKDGSAVGLATLSIPLEGPAAALAMSPDMAERGAAAVFALAAAIERVEDQYANVEATVR